MNTVVLKKFSCVFLEDNGYFLGLEFIRLIYIYINFDSEYPCWLVIHIDPGPGQYVHFGSRFPH